MANTTIPSELIQADVALGGSPTTTTQSASDNTTKIATTAYVTAAVNALIDSAPGTMNTLNEIAAALNDDAAFNTTVTNAIATKLPLAGGTMTGNIAHASDFTLDVAGDIYLDAGGDDIYLSQGGTHFGQFKRNSSNYEIHSLLSDGDIVFKGNDGGSTVTALTLDMSDAGTAIFNHDIQMSDLSFLRMGAGGDLIAYSDGTHALINANNGNLSFDVAGDIVIDADGGDIYLNDGGTGRGQISMANTDLTIISATSDRDLIFKGVDGASVITALTLDMSDAGSAIFNGNVTIDGFTNEKYLTLRSGFAPEASGGVGLRAANHHASNRDGLAIYGHDGVSILTGQTERMEINSTGQVLAQAHGVSTPSFSFIGDSNTGMTRPTGDTLQFICGGTVKLRVSGDGLLFNSDTASANALDDYEEGTFDPTLTTDSGSVTMYTTYNTLAYTKVGRVVTITGMLALTSVSSPSGEIVFGNLPFAMASMTNKAGQTRPSIHIYASGSNAPTQNAYFPAFIAFNEGGTTGRIVATYGSASDTSIANWMDSGSDIFADFSYITD